jgi:tetratricopeptide (TPR) repeat protein
MSMTRNLGRNLPWQAWALVRRVVLGAALIVMAAAPALASPEDDCFSNDFPRRVQGCTDYLMISDLNEAEIALALQARALAYSVQGHYAQAITDYDASLKIDPNSPIALNNRAWAYFKSGEPERGALDVEKALALQPDSAHTLDTRAHILQARGDTRQAMRDYERAMRFGGEHMVKLYQCGLQAHKLFEGEIDGLYTSAMRRGLETCVATAGCDPLPADEECRKMTS